MVAISPPAILPRVGPTGKGPRLHCLTGRLAGLRADNIFAIVTEIDLAAALETLNHELDVERLMLEGGGSANGALLRAGLVDRLSLVICPVIDGGSGAPSIFDSGKTDLGRLTRTPTLQTFNHSAGRSLGARCAG